jgi:hypothetical protein
VKEEDYPESEYDSEGEKEAAQTHIFNPDTKVKQEDNMRDFKLFI